ncbi:MAG: hypothetical protein LBK40_05475 [Spirochaetaceae bacterium]|jgi:hypothetical protein|nr:hypothetical protein [Spirochaetaceae bacterium]
MNRSLSLVAVVFALVSAFFVSAQEGAAGAAEGPARPGPEAQAAETSLPETLPDEDEGAELDEGGLPRSFRRISLGMGLDELKEALAQDNYFYFRGDRDVSLLPARNETLIDTTGFSFIRRASFQLKDGAVFIMAFTLDPGMLDHYSVFTSFVRKYGEPETLDPRQAVWTSEWTRVSIERPLTVKYIDLGVFNELVNESEVRASSEVYLRQEFLDSF